MCVAPKIPEPPPPPAQRQATKRPNYETPDGTQGATRRRGYSALVRRSGPSLQPASTTASLGGM